MPLPKKLLVLSGGSSRGFPYQSCPKTARRLTASDIKARRNTVVEVVILGNEGVDAAQLTTSMPALLIAALPARAERTKEA